MKPINCWEFMGCGREPGGAKADELGVCPAATADSFTGANGGTYAGRACWCVAGTFCGGQPQGSFAQKAHDCLRCEFFKSVRGDKGVTDSELLLQYYQLRK